MNKMFRFVAASASALALMGNAHAALPAEVSTAIADMKADGVLIAGAFLLVVIAIAAVKVLRSAK